MEERLKHKSLKELLNFRDLWDSWMRVNYVQTDQRISLMIWLDRWKTEDSCKKSKKSRGLKKKRSQKKLLSELKPQTNWSHLVLYQALTYLRMLPINLNNLLRSVLPLLLKTMIYLRARYKQTRKLKLHKCLLKTRLKHSWAKKLKLRKIKLWSKYLKIKKLNLLWLIKPFKINLSSNPSIRMLLCQVQQRTLEMLPCRLKNQSKSNRYHSQR